jgi:hypothetical protein
VEISHGFKSIYTTLQMPFTISIYESEINEKLDENCIPDTISRKGHTHSWNDLEDKPFYTERALVSYSFDGNIDKYEDIDIINTEFVTYIKVSDIVPQKEDVLGKTLVITDNDEDVTFEITEDIIVDGSEIGFDGYFVIVEGFGFLAVHQDASIEGLNFTKGVWFTYDAFGENVGYTKLLEVETGAIQQLDEKFIPDTIARLSDIGSGATFVVTITENEDDNTFSKDKSFEEIYSAVLEGQNVLCVIDKWGTKQFYSILDADYTGIVFVHNLMGNDNLCNTAFLIASDDSVELHERYMEIGNISELETNSKELVGAINELNSKIEEAGNSDDILAEAKSYADTAAAGYTHSNIYYKKIMIDSKDKAINKKISNISKTITEQNIDTAFNDIFGGE